MVNLLGWVIGLMLSFAVIAGISYVAGEIPCEAKADVMGLQHQFGLLEGCMIKVDKRWVPIESYRSLE